MSTGMTHSQLYSRIWRWHFFAGLFVVPFAILLAVTGSIYLFKHDIEKVIDHRVDARASVNTASLPADDLVEAALSAHPGATLVRYIVPTEDARSARILIKESGQQRLLWLDRGNRAVLKDVAERSRFIPTVTRIHSSVLAGKIGNLAIELAASLMIILILSGMWLYWPRGRSILSALMPNFSKRRNSREFWKSLHGSIGLIAGVFILGLLFSGLPWTGVWGKQFSHVRTAMGWTGPGQEWFVTLKSSPAPTEPRKTDGLKLWSTSDDMGEVILSSQIPPSNTHEQSLGQGAPLEWVVRKIEPEALLPPIWVQPPRGENGVWTVRSMPSTRHLRRTVHLDKWTGDEIMRIRFADYHPVEKAMGHGLSFHEGALFGIWNKILGIFIALSIIGLSLAGLLTWLKRRPARQLAAPALPEKRAPLPKSLLMIIAVLLIFLPVAGLAIVTVAGLSALAGLFTKRN